MREDDAFSLLLAIILYPGHFGYIHQTLLEFIVMNCFKILLV